LTTLLPFASVEKKEVKKMNIVEHIQETKDKARAIAEETGSHVKVGVLIFCPKAKEFEDQGWAGGVAPEDLGDPMCALCRTNLLLDDDVKEL